MPLWPSLRPYAATGGREDWSSLHQGKESLATDLEVLVPGAVGAWELPPPGTDTHCQARLAQDRDGHQTSHVITGQRDPAQHERDLAVGGTCNADRAGGHYSVPWLEHEPYWNKRPERSLPAALIAGDGCWFLTGDERPTARAPRPAQRIAGEDDDLDAGAWDQLKDVA